MEKSNPRKEAGQFNGLTRREKRVRHAAEDLEAKVTEPSFTASTVTRGVHFVVEILCLVLIGNHHVGLCATCSIP